MASGAKMLVLSQKKLAVLNLALVSEGTGLDLSTASLIIFEQWRHFLRDSPLLEMFHTFPISANRGSVRSSLPCQFHPAITYPPVQQHPMRNAFEMHHDDGC